MPALFSNEKLKDKECEKDLRKKQNKSAQITMFVILGLVLLIIFIIFLAIINSLKPKSASVEGILNELEAGRIKNHITNCIIQVTTEGIEKIGNNGGVIYDFEGGTIPFNRFNLGIDYLNYTTLGKTYFVNYGLKKNLFCQKVNYSTPAYPYLDTPLNNLGSIYSSDIISPPSCDFSQPYSSYDGFYGQNVMKKLCHTLRLTSCESFARGLDAGLTIQKQLENYTAQKLPLCINFDAFNQKMTVNISAQAPPMAEVNIHDSDLLVIVKYPIKISFENQEPIIKVFDYQTTLNIRLARTYNFLYNVFSLDSKKIDFNTSIDFISSVQWRDGLELKKYKDVCSTCGLPYKFDDIIEVTDRKSMVKGKAFVFRVAVEDRRPALDFIDDVKIDLKDTPELKILLKSYDPDDIRTTHYFLSFNIGDPTCNGAGDFVPPTLTTGYVVRESKPQPNLDYCNLLSGGADLNLITGLGVADCFPWLDGPKCEAAGWGWAVSGVGTAGVDLCDEDPLYQKRDFQGNEPYELALICNGGGVGYILGSATGKWSGDNTNPTCKDDALGKIIEFFSCNGEIHEITDPSTLTLIKDNIKNKAGSLYIGATGQSTRIRLCQRQATPPDPPTPCGAGWCEQDSRIQSSLPYSMIWAPLGRHDVGNHKVGVVSRDDNGLFDYQWFWINITDTRTDIAPRDDICTKACVVFECSNSPPGTCNCNNVSSWDSGERYENHYECDTSNGETPIDKIQPQWGNCLDWCKIAINYCNDVCGAGQFAPEVNTKSSDCWKCVYPILHSEDSENHMDCSALMKKACIQQMPNCFWIQENISGVFKESCYNDADLFQVSSPAYIITNASSPVGELK